MASEELDLGALGDKFEEQEEEEVCYFEDDAPAVAPVPVSLAAVPEAGAGGSAVVEAAKAQEQIYLRRGAAGAAIVAGIAGAAAAVSMTKGVVLPSFEKSVIPTRCRDIERLGIAQEKNLEACKKLLKEAG